MVDAPDVDGRSHDSPRSEITQLLNNTSGDRDEALAQVVTHLMEDLRRIARAHCHGEASDLTLQPTAVVNEAWIKLSAQDRVSWNDREHFLSVASLAMRRILIDHARKRRSLARGGDHQRVPMEAADAPPGSGSKLPDEFDLEALSQALQDLDSKDPELARIVDLRCLAGLSVEEVAALTNLSPATVKRRWALARGWIREHMEART